MEPRVRRGEGRAVALTLAGGHERALLAPARWLHCILFLFLSAMDSLPVDAHALLRTIKFVLRQIDGVSGSPPLMCCADHAINVRFPLLVTAHVLTPSVVSTLDC